MDLYGTWAQTEPEGAAQNAVTGAVLGNNLIEQTDA